MSDTRWSSRSSAMNRYTDPKVFEAAYKTLKHVADNAPDPESKSTALGLVKQLQTPKFIVMLTAFRDVLKAINKVSLYLQNKQIDLFSALEQVHSLQEEINMFRNSEEYWSKCMKEAEELASIIGVDLQEAVFLQEETTRKRKIPKRFDSRPQTAASFTVIDGLRINHFYPALDKMSTELANRFPSDLGDFAYLLPKRFGDSKAQSAINRLSERYRKFVGVNAVTEWGLFRHTQGLLDKTVVEVFHAVPKHYVDLKTLYRLFLTLPITTASAERGFSKLKLVENRLRTSQGQDRLESLLLLTAERDLAANIDPSQLVAAFADAADRRLLLK